VIENDHVMGAGRNALLATDTYILLHIHDPQVFIHPKSVSRTTLNAHAGLTLKAEVWEIPQRRQFIHPHLSVAFNPNQGVTRVE